MEDGKPLEIMASSDNVVRGGLTSKRMDSQALVDLLDPDAAPLLEVPRATLSPHEVRWQPPVPDFALSRVVVSNVPVTLAREPSDSVGPEVLLCLNGEVTVSSDGGDVNLRGGQSAFLSAAAAASPTVLVGRGQVYRATVGRASPGTGSAIVLGLTVRNRLRAGRRSQRGCTEIGVHNLVGTDAEPFVGCLLHVEVDHGYAQEPDTPQHQQRRESRTSPDLTPYQRLCPSPSRLAPPASGTGVCLCCAGTSIGGRGTTSAGGP